MLINRIVKDSRVERGFLEGMLFYSLGPNRFVGQCLRLLFGYLCCLYKYWTCFS